MCEFKYIVKVKDKKAIEKFEKLIGFKLPVSLSNVLLKNNYGYPVNNSFAKDSLSFSIKCLLSLNDDDDENIFDFFEASREEVDEIGFNFIPFAIDNYGNSICFIQDTNFVIYIDDETLEVFNTKMVIEEFFDNLKPED